MGYSMYLSQSFLRLMLSILLVFFGCGAGIELSLATGNEPLMSGGKTIQFTGECPSILQHSRYIRYDFDLNQEHFWLYVPPGYDGHEPWGLIVYTSPGPKREELPEEWGQVLIDDKLLFICPQQDGNDQHGDRREGLAVVAALEMIKLYSIDPNRVYATGFSGGARVACRLGFHQSDIFHATIQCCGADFNQPVPRVSVTDADLQTYPEAYGLLDADPQEVDKAKKNLKFVLITGSADFRQHFIEDIYNGGFKNEGFNATLLNVPGMGHEPCPARTLREALDFIEKPSSHDTFTQTIHLFNE
jgi:predicted esterase